MFIGVVNGILAALPYASPRLKILMAHHWCCRVATRAEYPGSVSREKLEIPGVKRAEGSWCGPKRRLRSETKIGPWSAYPRGLRLGRDLVILKGIVIPFTHGWLLSAENSCSRDLGE